MTKASELLRHVPSSETMRMPKDDRPRCTICMQIVEGSELHVDADPYPELAEQRKTVLQLTVLLVSRMQQLAELGVQVPSESLAMDRTARLLERVAEKVLSYEEMLAVEAEHVGSCAEALETSIVRAKGMRAQQDRQAMVPQGAGKLIIPRRG